jgi:threonine dehydrogenase-like Zn-dependent dehydrogenase
VRGGMVDPTHVLTQNQPLVSAIEAYQMFDQHEPGWMKVRLEPAASEPRQPAPAHATGLA